MGAHTLLDPSKDDVEARVLEVTARNGVDVMLEMSGHPAAIRQGFRILSAWAAAHLFSASPRSR